MTFHRVRVTFVASGARSMLPAHATVCASPARLAGHVAFMYLGEVVEFDMAERIFVAPRDRRTEAYVTGRFG